jgi:aspartyl-tRNA(Asn)/glutamyl-tRNA(Gln) amidotransferase subunit A
MLPTATEALDLFRRGELCPGELLAEALAAVDGRDGELGAYVAVDREGARRAAAAADEAWRTATAGPLCGVPLSIKDIIDVQGLPTGCGNPAARPPATKDATAVRLLRAAGAVILGKVHLHEYALGITGENPRLGTPRNPHDPSRLPGGSSSGSGVSVAAGMAVASVGTDTGGSVRVPAALCGVVGFKPSFGRVSRRGVFPLSWSMDHVGVLARTVEDARLLWSVLDREDPEDDRTLGLPRGEQVTASPGESGRVALLAELHDAASAEVRAVVEHGAARLGELGIASFERVQLPGFGELRATYRTMVIAEAAAVHREALTHDTVSFGPDVGSMLAEGAALPAVDYVLARQRRRAFAAACDRLLERFDALATPTTLVPAPERGAAEIDVDGAPVPVRAALLSCTSPFSMVGLPALSIPVLAPFGRSDTPGIPCGFSSAGLPLGLQLVGRRHRDAALLELGAACAGGLRRLP